MVVLATVDGGPNSENVVSTGGDLASAFDTELFVIHVLSESTFESRHENRPEYYRSDAENDAESVASRLIEDATNSPSNARAIGRIGDVATEVLDFADEIDAQYLVTGGRRKSPVGKAVFGSDTQQILLSATVPVVTVMGETGAPE